jgi:hypothetical protein
MEMHDHIVVGSGCTGAMAAQTLVEAGVKVTMLDVGVTDNKYKHLIPHKDFVSIRRTEPEQHRYFLGDDFESVPWGNIKTGAQLTPPRQFMIQEVEKLLPMISDSFHPMESLAYGGLGSGWGVGCCVFSKPELEKAGLDHARMMSAYRAVSERIGISGAMDDASTYTNAGLDNIQPATELDENCGFLYGKYKQKKASLNRNGFYMGRPALALITRDMNERKKFAYRDMEFYSDEDQSAYRPWITVDQLKKRSNFNYIGQRLVLSFEEMQDHVAVKCLDTSTNEEVIYKAKKLVLASGVLGTARIVLRSMGDANKQLPLLCNPYSYVPCVQLGMVGREISAEKNGFAQLVLFHDPSRTNMNVAMASVYSYRSLMLFRIIREAPLNFVDGRIIMRYLMPGITIMGIHHPEQAGQGKYLALEKDGSSLTGDRLRAAYELTDDEETKVNDRERKFVRAMRRLGCYAIKRIHPGHGSSIHYAGSLPFDDSGRPYTISTEGRLSGTRNVFVADGSGFKYLPAKGLTFSIMANAHLVAQNVLKNE